MPVLVVALVACNPYVQGNGVYVEENRTASLAAFAGVRVENGVEVTVTANVPADQRSVVVSGDANLVPYIETSVEQDAALGIAVLHVRVAGLSGGYDATIPPRVVVKEGAFQSVSASGASKVSVVAATAPVFTVVGADRSQVTLAAPQFTADAGDGLAVTLSGASSLDARSYRLTAPSAEKAAAAVTLSGGSRAMLHADGAELGAADAHGVAVTGTADGAETVVDNRLGHGESQVVLTGTAVYCAPGTSSCP